MVLCQMFVILSSNLFSFIEDILKIQCLSKCKMHCLLWRKLLDENKKGWAYAENTHIYIYMDTDTDMCITMSMIKYIHRGMPLTEAIHEYDSDMNQNELFSSHLPQPKMHVHWMLP